MNRRKEGPPAGETWQEHSRRHGRGSHADGVENQAETGATGGSDAGAPEPRAGGKAADAKKRKARKTGAFSGFLGHGGQSNMGYHGTGQLGSRKTRPGGNANSGSTEE